MKALDIANRNSFREKLEKLYLGILSDNGLSKDNPKNFYRVLTDGDKTLSIVMYLNLDNFSPSKKEIIDTIILRNDLEITDLFDENDFLSETKTIFIKAIEGRFEEDRLTTEFNKLIKR